jgi:cell division protease FtsH
MSQNHKKKSLSKKNGAVKKSLYWFGAFFVFLYVVNLVNLTMGVAPKELTYSEFYRMLLENAKTQKIKAVSKIENMLTGDFSDGSKFTVNIPERDDKLLDLLREQVSNFDVKPLKTFWTQLFYSLVPMVLFIAVLWYFSYRGSQMGNKVWSFGRARARTSAETASAKVTFNDVAGVEEAKEELREVIEFLKDPKRFQRLGGKIPKGVLLIGSPGTGKTLLAKAVAGEASVPFFSISGSDFVEMFVGVGASRVRDLFEQGRRAAKVSGRGCIIFIDEIDAVGRLRFSGIGGGHDEREQTLNALLVEMDGFDTQEGVILIAATNRPDTLDPALLRPGRFDRQIVVPLPDIIGREAILKVHTRNIRLAPNTDLKIIAQQTSGFSGADLANLCNEAALLAARENKDAVNLKELESAIERVMMGPAKKSHVISKKEKDITAYHESGHALLTLLIPETDPLRKVSIIPRGMAGGYTLTPPTEDKHYWSKKDLEAKMAVALGGRVSEELFIGEVTTGAENDLEMVTRLARKMVCEFGMSKRLGNMTLGRRHGPLFLGRDIVEERDYSEDTAKVIDEEVRVIVNKAYEKAKALLEQNQDKLKLLAQTLSEKEVLDVLEVRNLLNLPANAA